jgi:hypothetical protein
MQICNCTVAIGGEVGMTVAKERVTIPELAILRVIHGEDAVRNIEVIADESMDSSEERSRLNAIYRSPENVVRDTFGGAGVLPKTLEDAGISDEFVISNTALKTKRKAKASAAEEMTAAEVAAE